MLSDDRALLALKALKGSIDAYRAAVGIDPVAVDEHPRVLGHRPFPVRGDRGRWPPPCRISPFGSGRHACAASPASTHGCQTSGLASIHVCAASSGVIPLLMSSAIEFWSSFV